MGLNIAITSKYDPFTYEDYIKPLEGYWEDYDKHEADLDKLATDTATLREVIDSMPDESEEKTKYTGYLQALDAQSSSLATNGLNSANRKALRNLKNQYASLMPRLALAEEARRKDLAEYIKRVNSGEYFMYNDNPSNKNVVDYLDGNLPTYNAGLNKKLFGQEVENVAKAYSNRIFNDVDAQEVERIGKKFLQLTEEKGINADLSDIEGSEQFSPILEELYAEAGVENMSQAEAAKTKDFINRKFWEGLVYQKATDYKPISTSNNESPYTVITTLPNGDRVIRSGNKHFILGKNGSLSEYNENPSKPLTPKQQAEAYDRTTYLENTVEGFDNWNQNNIYNKGKVKEHDEKFTNDPKKLVGKYVLSVTSPDTTWDRHRSTLITEDLSTLYDKALTKAKNKSLFKKYRQPENTIFIGSGSAIGRRSGDEKGEFFGDNHISLINVDTFFNHLPADDSQLFPVLEDIHKAYSEIPNHEAPKKVLEKLKEYRDSLVAMDSSDRPLDQKVEDALKKLSGQSNYLYKLLVLNGNQVKQASGTVTLPD